MKYRVATLLCMGVALLLGGCREKCEDPVPDLVNKRWMLEQIDDFPVSLSSFYQDNASYVQFAAAGNEVLGVAACDAIKGKFVLEAASQHLGITQVALTKGSCSSPVVAGRYLAALPQTKRYNIQGSQLLLYDDDNVAAKPRLVFQAAK